MRVLVWSTGPPMAAGPHAGLTWMVIWLLQGHMWKPDLLCSTCWSPPSLMYFFTFASTLYSLLCPISSTFLQHSDNVMLGTQIWCSGFVEKKKTDLPCVELTVVKVAVLLVILCGHWHTAGCVLLCAPFCFVACFVFCILCFVWTLTHSRLRSAYKCVLHALFCCMFCALSQKSDGQCNGGLGRPEVTIYIVMLVHCSWGWNATEGNGKENSNKSWQSRKQAVSRSGPYLTSDHQNWELNINQSKGKKSNAKCKTS